MEARFARALSTAALAVGLALIFTTADSSRAVHAAGYRTTNFTVSAPSASLAKEIGEKAELWRKQLSIEWLGEEMPAWSEPCPINARVAPRLGAGGMTSFVFDRGEVFNWKMNVQGSRERILDSVLPHEITHTIFASYFRQPLPRWADEGACTTVEHRSEVAKQERMLIDFLKTGHGIPFGQMFAMKEYPRDVMPLYSQGHSLAQWLIESRGKRAFLAFLADGMQDENWPRAVEQYYGFNGLPAMQESWLAWVKQGRPRLTPETSPIATQLASHTSSPTAGSAARGGESNAIYRGQSPDDITPIARQTPITPIGVTAADPRRATAEAVSPDSSTPGGSSVYAAVAARAKQRRKFAARAARPGGGVYDASRPSGVIRR